MITIKDHILVSNDGSSSVSYDPTPNHGTIFRDGLPDTVVIHYTGGNSLESSVKWLQNPVSKASAHLVVGKKGEIVQLIPFNQKAWHAGKSEWNGRKNLNQFSIGIEIDNAGLLEKRADGFYTFWGKRIDNSQVVLASHKHDKREQAWEAFTEKQIVTVEMIILELKKHYPIKEIVGHDDIAPGRKIDPGPAFPFQKIKNRLFSTRNEDVPTDTTPKDLHYGIVVADYLNIRTEPSRDSQMASDPLPKGTKLRIIERKNGWLRVKVELQGWVSQSWVNQF
ncbi:N-acetylmuramoyl-L-alanine amidase [Thermophagus sp. OGC60D27]|uniref:N-acetylmuramoyl-L-alanine amidase n=1 Tax=Thermophagus sp. OGC60D27 TaxID=3458415 RepID=UPI004037C38F